MFRLFGLIDGGDNIPAVHVHIDKATVVVVTHSMNETNIQISNCLRRTIGESQPICVWDLLILSTNFEIFELSDN